jgi:sugar lactone lactonase YvrE
MASGDGIVVYSQAGLHLGTIRPPERPSNCCFGEGFRGLYITAQKSVYHVPTKAGGTRTF